MSAWDGCAKPPMPVSTERDIDPYRNTVPRAESVYIVSFDEQEGLIRRPAVQADIKHCASCSCPPEDHHNPPGKPEATP